MPPTVHSVKVFPASATLQVGQTIQFVAEVNADYGSAPEITWSSSDPRYVVVSATGLAAAVAITPGGPTAASVIVSAGQHRGVASILVKPLALVGPPTVQQLRQEAAQLQDSLQDDFFTKLVQLNFKYIDIYYEQTRTQANKSFWLALGVAVFGLIVVVAGIISMFRGLATAAYVTTSAGVVSEFIASVFFYLYNRTILKMSEYHRKLVLTQNISIALKIVEGLPGEARARAQEALVLRLTEDVNRLLVSDSAGLSPAKSEAP